MAWPGHPTAPDPASDAHAVAASRLPSRPLNLDSFNWKSISFFIVQRRAFHIRARLGRRAWWLRRYPHPPTFLLLSSAPPPPMTTFIYFPREPSQQAAPQRVGAGRREVAGAEWVGAGRGLPGRTEVDVKASMRLMKASTGRPHEGAAWRHGAPPACHELVTFGARQLRLGCA